MRKLLVETKPLEVIYNEDTLNEEIMHMLKTCYFHPQLSKMAKKGSWHSGFAFTELDRMFKGLDHWPAVLQTMR